jgi:crossover junction endodeoxyribonuclease RusA
VGAQAQGLTLELPFPPSTNTYWRHITIGKRARTLISEKGRAYRVSVAETCMIKNIPTYMHGPIACTLDLYPPCNRRRDCDNYAKALLDALTYALVYNDDSQIIDLHIRMHPKHAPGRVVVTLTPISAPHSAHNQMEIAACN